MTFQKDQIQRLISEIDTVLAKPHNTRRPWSRSGEVAQQRQIIEKVRGYLVRLQRNLTKDRTAANQLSTEGRAQTYSSQAQVASDVTSAASAQQVLRAVLQEMEYLRRNTLHPLQTEITELQQQRDQLRQEVKQLEEQRQQTPLLPSQMNQEQLITEFLQVLMSRLQVNLTEQVAQTIATLENQAFNSQTWSALPASSSSAEQPLLHPAQRMERLQLIQNQSDQLLLKLDSTLSVMFETLQKNIQSYEHSLGQGLDKMHSMGQRGEALFASLISDLAEKLGREASAYLEPSPDWGAVTGQVDPGRLRQSASLSLNAISQEDTDAEAEISLADLEADIEKLTAELAEETAALDNLDLSNLDLASLKPDSASLESPSNALSHESVEPLSEQLEAEIAQIQVQSSIPSTASNASESDVALEFIDQFSAAVDDVEISDSAPNLEGAEISKSENMYDELDDFYRSFFNTDNAERVNTEQTVAESAQSDLADSSELESPPHAIGVEDNPHSDESDQAPGQDALAVEALLKTEPAPTPASEPLELETTHELDGPQPGAAETQDQARQGESFEDLLFSDDFADKADSLTEADDQVIPETITTLSDLIVAPDRQNPVAPVATGVERPIVDEQPLEDALSIQSGRVDELTEDAYVQAAPEENLLAQEDLKSGSDISLKLDSGMLKQLSEDLSSLENLESKDLLAAEANLDAVNHADSATFTDGESIAEVEQLPTDASSAEVQSDLRLEELMPETVNLVERSEKKKIVPETQTAVESPEIILQPTEIVLRADADSPHPPQLENGSGHRQIWHLGIDLGATGLSAVLLNRLTGDLYPLYWTQGEADAASDAVANHSSWGKSFRLPAAVYLASAHLASRPDESQSEAISEARLPTETDIFVGQMALDQARQNGGLPGQAIAPSPLPASGLLLQHFKPYLKVG
nr:hypothetical protein [Cyanothece sp. SIO1E1]